MALLASADPLGPALTDPLWGDEPAIEGFGDVIPDLDGATCTHGHVLYTARLNSRAIPIDSIEARCSCLHACPAPAQCRCSAFYRPPWQ